MNNLVFLNLGTVDQTFILKLDIFVIQLDTKGNFT